MSGEAYTYSVAALNGQSNGPEVTVFAGTIPQPSTDASLNALVLTDITLTFDPENTQYTVNVENDLLYTTVTVTANDSGASYRIELGGVVDEDGTVPLAAGENVISVQVTAQDGVTSRSYTVNIHRAGGEANNPATGQPTVSGTAQVGETLTASTSGISDEDGITNATFVYQWMSNDGATDSDISGETGATYLVQPGDVGKTIKVRVSFTDDEGNYETMTSPATATVRHPGDAVAWEGELTAGQEAGIIPVMSGYSSFGDLGGILSPDTFVLDGTTYRVQFLVHANESLWLGMYGELPVDFILRVGDSAYRGSASMLPLTISVGAYWWPSATPDWTIGDPVQVSLAVHPDVPLGTRQKAPVTGHFRNVPSEHGGDEDFSFRIYFTEVVSTTAGALRDHVLAVTGGVVSSVEAVGDDGRIWAVSVTPGIRRCGDDRDRGRPGLRAVRRNLHGGRQAPLQPDGTGCGGTAAGCRWTRAGRAEQPSDGPTCHQGPSAGGSNPEGEPVCPGRCRRTERAPSSPTSGSLMTRRSRAQRTRPMPWTPARRARSSG